MKNTRCSGSSKGKVKVELKKTEARICEKKKKSLEGESTRESRERDWRRVKNEVGSVDRLGFRL
jgi:hypothetical protein